jgi:putative ABC transport system ATP-binding protein
VALNDVSLSFKRGETVMITGGNGSGKTTLLRAIAGTVPVKGGRVLLCGRDVTNWPAHKRARFLSYVYQDPMLGTCPNLSVYENLCLATAQPWWYPKPQTLHIRGDQLKLLEDTGLPLAAKAAAPVNVLSGGQRQALSVVLAYSKGRAIALLDEFTSSLDASVKNNVLEFIRVMTHARACTTLVVTHSPAQMATFVQSEIRLSGGTVEGFRNEHATPYSRG